MNKILYSLFICACATFCVPAFSAGTFSCGEGYVLVSHSKIDGITAMECEKLWCRDLETGLSMGSGNTAANGYRTTSTPQPLSDNTGKTIVCFGDRKWCSGEVVGEWNADFGGYVRPGDEPDPNNNSKFTYQSYQKGSCFAWRLEKPSCDAGETAVLQNGKWNCIPNVGTKDVNRASSVRRTGALMRR